MEGFKDCNCTFFSSNFKAKKKVSGFWSQASDLRVSIFSFLFLFCCETMSNCSQNCWIDWNSAVLCFKRFFSHRVWTFAWFVRPLLATTLCLGNLVPVMMCTCTCITSFIARQKKIKNQTHHHTDFEADLWPETRYFFFLGGGGGGLTPEFSSSFFLPKLSSYMLE